MAAPESAVLVLALLSVESSYKDNVERPRGPVADTVQFWVVPGATWRIRTYAIDHDIHTYRIGDASSSYSPESAVENIRKSYGDVVQTLITITFPRPHDPRDCAQRLSEHGLKGKLEVAGLGFAFYNPDSALYHTVSRPRE